MEKINSPSKTTLGINAQNLKKVYGEFTAVDDVSFCVNEGEIFGFLGPNGAGKTSTINMLIGLSKVSSGNITIGGIDCVKNTKKAQRIMGIVPDESNLYDEMSGLDNLCFCAALYGMKKRERIARANELLEQFNLSHAASRPFKAYSKGMRRKLCIAAGIIHRPKILFLDEPTTGIDVESARHIRNLILDLKSQGTTVFITTHYIEDAQRICDRIAFIVSGKIVRIGSVDELMSNADNEYILHIRHSPSKDFTHEFGKKFDNIQIELQNPASIDTSDLLSSSSCILRSKNRISLNSVLSFFEAKNITIFEGRELRPTLEDVFVKITGIEADKLKNEKEGRK